MTTDEPGEPTATVDSDTSPRKRITRIVIVIAVLVVLFGLVLPQIIDYELVWEAITELSLEQLLVLSALGVLRVPTEALIYRAMLPGLGIARGSAAYLSSNVAANVMPPPASSVVQYAYFRADGFDGQASMTGAAGSFVFPQGARIVLPVVAFVVLLAAGAVDTEALVITGISLVVVGIVAWLIRLIGPSETAARWLGAKLGAMISWMLVKFKRDPVGDLGDAVVDFRNNAYAVVRERWLFGTIAVTLNLGLTYLILVASLRAVGIEAEQLGLAAIFACFAVSFFAGVVIPITGSGLGVVDVVMVSALSAAATSGVDVNIIVAAVVLWRLFYGLLAILPGALTLTKFTKENSELLHDASRQLQGEPAEGAL